MEDTFANVMRISTTGFGLVLVVMVLLAGIMEVTGMMVQRWEKKQKEKLKGNQS
ncbi:MAG: hypothetical protein JXO49_10030 [Deltaproteobacteria bacterium]|nr:hypothetical protein [Candidatus Anaeroferrophillus wilburensis]MBN2889670.1 hypothetical protein [Deltaproteobacteria bacterium]